MKPTKVSSSRVLGGVFLTAGSCIGAGMLGLPILTGLSGFFPSLIMMIVAWCFMTYTALLLIEVNGWFDHRVNLLTMVGQAFGKKGQILSWVLYLFLFYALLVAYIAVSGKIFSSFIPLQSWLIGLLFTVVFGFFIYLGTRLVDLSNRWMMMGLIASYLAMIFFGLGEIQVDLLKYASVRYMLIPLSVLVTSFGFHNIIPSLTSYMHGDLKKVRQAILGGSFLTLAVYFFWNLFVLGIVPVEGSHGIYESFLSSGDASGALQWFVKSPYLSGVIAAFSLFAIITSFLAQGMGLMHFIADGLHVKPEGKDKKWLIAITLLPPLILAQLYPAIFLAALSFAGGFCAVILFGILPAAMVWKGRFITKMHTSYHVLGGKFVLFVIASFSSFLLIMEVLRMFGILERV